MIEDTKKYTVLEHQSLEEALTRINQNGSGAVFVVNAACVVLGSLTDGDVRRWLLSKRSLNAAVSECMVTSFVSVALGTPREQILKLLDYRIQILPVLTSEGKLAGVVTRKSFPIQKEQSIVARARAPMRISFSGGGTDFTRYFVSRGGSVLSATIQLFAHASLRKREDSEIYITSHDLKESVHAASLADLKRTGPIALVASLIQLIRPAYGFELVVHSDVAVGSGLGGSASILAAIMGCFNEFREDTWNNYEMAEMAFQAERLTLDVAGGWQDQYATVFGGFNYIEFQQEQNRVYPLRLRPETLHELEECLLLSYTGRPRDLGKPHSQMMGQAKGYASEEEIQGLVDLTRDMKDHLLRGQLFDFGRKLGLGWQLKKKMSDQLTDPAWDRVYELAMEKGALGGKLLGAGGGGYFLFHVDPARRKQVAQVLNENGLQAQSLVFDEKGVHSWKVRNELPQSKAYPFDHEGLIPSHNIPQTTSSLGFPISAGSTTELSH